MSAPLRVGIDARELLGETTGVGRYLGELLLRWTARADSAARQFVLYSPAPLKAVPRGGTTEVRIIPGGAGTWWEQTALRAAARRDKLDVFFAPAYTAPVGLPMPSAVTIHDVSFLAHPEWFRPRERWRRRILTTRSARQASVIFTDSEFSRGEIEARIGVDRGRIHVIAPGVSPPPARVPDVAAGASPTPPLVLFVGSLFNRRRLPDLIAAFAKATVAIADATLVIVGANRTWPAQDLPAEAEAHGVGGRVRVVDYVDERELGALYARASVFAFLSEYEGFGMTPLEALSAGVPIVVLDTPIAREVYGDAAEFVPAGNVEAAARAIERFLRSPDARRAQLAHAPSVLARYSWDRAAEETLRRIEGIVR